MANNLRKFTDYAAYSAATLVKPAVSLIADTNAVHFDQVEPPTPTINGDISLTFNVSDASQEVHLWYNDESASEPSDFAPTQMWIDGVEETPVSSWRFDTTGDHIVEFAIAEVGGEKEIPDIAFKEIGNITNVIIGSGITSIGGTDGEGAFAYCSGLTSVTIGDNVTFIGTSTFYECTSLTSCTIGTGVTNIGDMVFYRCSGLTSIDIPNSVTSIGENTFMDCTSLTTLTIGSGITSIGYHAFQGHYNFTSITIEATTPPTMDNEDGGVFDLRINCPIYVPAESVSAYQNSQYWSYWSSLITAIQ